MASEIRAESGLAAAGGVGGGVVRPGDQGGDRWDGEIKRKLEEADLYVLLVSRHFLDSDYVHETELPVAMRRHEEKKARLVPVVVGACGWKQHLGGIQALPSGGEPVKGWKDKD